MCSRQSKVALLGVQRVLHRSTGPAGAISVAPAWPRTLDLASAVHKVPCVSPISCDRHSRFMTCTTAPQDHLNGARHANGKQKFRLKLPDRPLPGTSEPTLQPAADATAVLPQNPPVAAAPNDGTKPSVPAMQHEASRTAAPSELICCELCSWSSDNPQAIYNHLKVRGQILAVSAGCP